MGEAMVVVYVDELRSSCGISHCRICHEAEFESSKQLEAPCACSGTAKFAHRDCIQRWCNEKGNTICEICLQNYEPGYTAPSKKKKCDATDDWSIRDSLEVPRREHDQEEEQQQINTTNSNNNNNVNTECSSGADRIASFCRSLALMFTGFLLMRHFCETVTNGTEDYPFTLVTILFLRMSGILLPMYIIFRTFAALHESICRQYEDSGDDNYTPNSDRDEEDDDHQQQHLV